MVFIISITSISLRLVTCPQIESYAALSIYRIYYSSLVSSTLSPSRTLSNLSIRTVYYIPLAAYAHHKFVIYSRKACYCSLSINCSASKFYNVGLICLISYTLGYSHSVTCMCIYPSIFPRCIIMSATVSSAYTSFRSRHYTPILFILIFPIQYCSVRSFAIEHQMSSIFERLRYIEFINCYITTVYVHSRFTSIVSIVTLYIGYKYLNSVIRRSISSRVSILYNCKLISQPVLKI